MVSSAEAETKKIRKESKEARARVEEAHKVDVARAADKAYSLAMGCWKDAQKRQEKACAAINKPGVCGGGRGGGGRRPFSAKASSISATTCSIPLPGEGRTARNRSPGSFDFICWAKRMDQSSLPFDERRVAGTTITRGVSIEEQLFASSSCCS